MKKSVDMLVTDIMCSLINVVPLASLGEVKNILYQHLGGKTIYDDTVSDLPSVQSDDTFELINIWGQCLRLQGLSEETIRQYTYETRSFFLFSNKHFSEVSTVDVRSYLAYRQQSRHCNDVTINNKICCLRAFYRFVMREDLISDGGLISRKPKKDPMAKVENLKTERKVKKVFSAEQVELMRVACDRERDLAMMLTLTSTGMRVGELIRIDRSDIDMETGQCLIHGKGKKDRYVYVSPSAMVHIKRYLADRDDKDSALFASLKHHNGSMRLTRAGVAAILKRVAERTEEMDGVRVHPHAFRYYVATSMSRKGARAEDIQMLLGHANVDTTLRCYIMRDANTVKDVCARYATA